MPIASAGHRWAPASKNELARQLTYDYRTTKKHENTDIHTHARTNTYINATNAGTNELLLITLPPRGVGNTKDQNGLQERQLHKDFGSPTHQRRREFRQQFSEILFDDYDVADGRRKHAHTHIHTHTTHTTTYTHTHKRNKCLHKRIEQIAHDHVPPTRNGKQKRSEWITRTPKT